jgi:ATPase family associated with various cellular activities (AAA)
VTPFTERRRGVERHARFGAADLWNRQLTIRSVQLMFTDGEITRLLTALERNPGDVTARLQLAEIYLDHGRAAESLNEVRRALVDEPHNHRALGLGAMCAELTGDTPAAQAMSSALRILQEASDPVPAATTHGGSGGTRPAAASALAESARLFGATDTPPSDLSAVAGMATVKHQLEQAFLAPVRAQLDAPADFRGSCAAHRTVLYGPPGCGKTLLARATAGALGVTFVGVSLREVLDPWGTPRIADLRELFDVARRHEPCVLGLDHLDVLAHRRLRLGALRRDAVGELVTLLAELDERRAPVYVMATTSRPWDVPAELFTPGRFEHTLLVPPPDVDARHQLIASQLQRRSSDTGVDVISLAQRTDGFLPADLERVVSMAADLAFAHSQASGRLRPINTSDLDAALEQVKPRTLGWFDTAYNWAAFARSTSALDPLFDYIRRHVRR